MNTIIGILKIIHRGLRVFGGFVSNVVNYILLSIVYALGIGPISIILKIFGKQFLVLKSKNRDSYWVDRNVSKQSVEDYYKMF